MGAGAKKIHTAGVQYSSRPGGRVRGLSRVRALASRTAHSLLALLLRPHPLARHMMMNDGPDKRRFLRV
jgi:hypothetical protein